MYDFIMKLDGATLMFAPWMFPPKTERLLELVAGFRRLGYQNVIVDWGGLFPWSEPLFHSGHAYPEHAVVEFHKRALDCGLTLLPRFPFGGGMSNFLSNHAYRNLCLRGFEPDSLDPAAPGAAKFVCDLLADMRALLPDLPAVYIDPLAGDCPDEDYVERLMERVFPRLLDEVEGVRLVTAPSLDVPAGAASACTPLAVRPDDFVRGNQHGFPPTVEIYLDLMPAAKGKKAGGHIELERSKRLRGEFAGFSEGIDSCWDIVRSVSESSCLPPSLGYSPERSRAELSRGIEKLESILDGLSSSLEGFGDLLQPLLAPGILSSWAGSRIGIVHEQIARLREKARLVSVWIETV